MRFLFTIQYLGTRYAGWQTQSNATGVQQVIETALAKLAGEPVRIEGAGRTDSGVHARAQRAHVDLPFDIEPQGLILGANTNLPADIRITGAEVVDEAFHCRFEATGKTYLYQIWNAPVADVFHRETHAHVTGALDEAAMAEAAALLVGHHDFRSFTVAAPEVSSTWRTLETIEISREAYVVRIAVRADGFLRYMVRRIAGSLIEVGAGRLEREDVGRALEPSFEEARWTAPAQGLQLYEVHYG